MITKSILNVNTRKNHKSPSGTTKSRIVKNENKPTHFNNEQNTPLENDVPTWNIGYRDFLPFYVKAYQERFIEWKNEEGRDCCDEERDPKFFSKENIVALCQRLYVYFNNSSYHEMIFCILKISFYIKHCWNRAYYFARKITDLVRAKNPSKTFPKPYKHYMFGSFIRTVKKGKPGEFVRWTKHVAPIIRLKDTELYILDPLLSDGSMKKDEFHAEIVNANHMSIRSRLDGYVTCVPDTYANCFEPKNKANDPNIEDDDLFFDTRAT